MITATRVGEQLSLCRSHEVVSEWTSVGDIGVSSYLGAVEDVVRVVEEPCLETSQRFFEVDGK